MCDINNCKVPKVVIIDSGVDIKRYDLNKNVKNSISYKLNNRGEVVEDSKIKARNDHGTAIAMIIKCICKKVEIFSINILDENLRSDGRVLIYALKKAVQIKPDIIHLSLGTTKFRYKYALSKIVKRAGKNNIVVVSAYSNDGKDSYPAALKRVVGVKSSEIRANQNIYFHKNTFFAPPIIIYDELKSFFKCGNMYGNSIAAAYITGHICKNINGKQNVNNNELINYLIEQFS
ncbi:MAG: S8 family serine peptidase [Clostridium sp.]|uniref:S8 family serine peptidase n=1 Tax=Clostridium sp. TaxID=1506 RepID=UPI003D6D821C